MSWLIENDIPGVLYNGFNTNKDAIFGGNLTVLGTTSIAGVSLTDLTVTGNTLIGNAVTDTLGIQGATSIKSTSASSLVVGANGATTPAFQVDSSTASQVTGFSVTGAATGGTVALAVIQTSGNANLTLDAKGSGTIVIGSVSTGAITLTRATTVTGALTTTGGITPVTKPQVVYTVGGAPIAAATGTDNACAANTVTWSAIYFPVNMTVTGLAFLIGSVGGTNKTVLSLYDSTGAFLKSTTLAGGGTTVGTTATWQSIDLTATQAVTGGTIYYVATNFDGNTAKYRGYPIVGSKFVTGTASQTLGTPATITPGTSFNADVGPIMFAY